jgi:hypothetical protein
MSQSIGLCRLIDVGGVKGDDVAVGVTHGCNRGIGGIDVGLALDEFYSGTQMFSLVTSQRNTSIGTMPHTIMNRLGSGVGTSHGNEGDESGNGKLHFDQCIQDSGFQEDRDGIGRR